VADRGQSVAGPQHWVYRFNPFEKLTSYYFEIRSATDEHYDTVHYHTGNLKYKVTEFWSKNLDLNNETQK